MMKHELARYDAYKDSGVEWIGETPAQWEVTRNKDIFEERGILSNSGTETLLTVSHITGVTRRTEKNVNMFMAETMEGYKLCKKGDLIINTMWAWMGALGTCNENGICSPAYGVYKPKKYKPYNHRYFDYLYRIPNSITEMTKNSKGIVSSRLRLYPKEFFQIKTALPNYATQKAIADYLDTKTAQIDRKIDLLTQKATKYGKLKQSLINETVTRGLDKNVAKKDSGVGWIGEVPAHWIVKRLKDIINVRSGDTGISKSDTGTYPIYGANGIIGMCDFYNQSEKRILIGRVGTSGAITEAFGKYVVSDNALIVTLSKHALHRFMFYKLVALNLENLSSKNAQPLLTGTSVKNLLSSFPTLPEQTTIADYLDTKTAHIDRIVETINTQIDKLKELRKTLINDVVTGKIKVA